MLRMAPSLFRCRTDFGLLRPVSNQSKERLSILTRSGLMQHAPSCLKFCRVFSNIILQMLKICAVPSHAKAFI